MCSNRIGGVSVLPVATSTGASTDGSRGLNRSLSDSATTVLKEGVVDKESHGVIYSWRPRFCVLTKECLTIFKSDPRRKGHEDGDDNKKRSTVVSERAEKRNVLYRLPLEEISTMSNIDKGRQHIHFTICTKQGVFDLRVTHSQRDWLTQIQLAVADRRSRNDFMRELKTRTSVVASKYRKHSHKRASFTKDHDYGDGIGITIRNEADAIVIARIFFDGPAAKKGTLRPGDEIIEVDGKTVRGLSAERVAGLIKGQPDHVVLTVKPTWVDRGTNTSPADFALSRPLCPKPNNLRGRVRPHSLADVAVATDPEVQSATNDVNDASPVPLDRKKFSRRPALKPRNKTEHDNRLSLP